MKKRPFCFLCLALFILISIIMALWGERFVKELKPSPMCQEIKDGSVVTVEGQIYKKEIKEKNQLLYLKNNSIVQQGQSVKESNIIIYDSTFLTCVIGNKIRLTGKVRFFEYARNPGNFDQKIYYQKQDIHASIMAKQIEVSDHSQNQFLEVLWQFRESINVRLKKVLGERDGAVLAAILLGEKGGLDPQLKELYQKNGIGHILAISGLHISFLGAGFYSLLRKMGCSYVAAGAAGIVLLGVYTIMIGAGISAVRALIMFLVRMGADITGHIYDMATAAALASVLIICVKPLYIYDAGFLLSFGAIAGIVLVAPALQNLWFGTENRIVQSLCISVSVNLMIFPILLYYFFEFPLYSFALNLVVIPLMSWLLGSAVLGNLIYLVLPIVGTGVLWHLKGILWIYEKICELAGKLPFAHLVFGQPQTWQIVVYYIGLGIILYCGYKKKSDIQTRKARLVPFVVAGIIIAICMPIYRRPGTMEVVMMDVGQGDGTFLRSSKGITCFFDGGSSDVSQVGKYRIEPFLKSQGVATLDYVFLSHGDADHMNGIEELLKRQEMGVKIEHLVLPVKNVWNESLQKVAVEATKNGIKVVEASPGAVMQEGQFYMECLQPGVDYRGEDGNAASMVLAITYGQFDLLMTGDVEGMGEEMLADKGLKQYEVLKVAHHGSKNSSELPFLEKVRPLYALISAGKNNRYGHPHEETLQRFESVKSQTVETAKVGAIKVVTNGRDMSVKAIMN